MVRLCCLRETPWKKKHCSHPLIHFTCHATSKKPAPHYEDKDLCLILTRLFHSQYKEETKRREMPDAVINWYYTLMHEWDWHEIIFKTREDVSCLSPSPLHSSSCLPPATLSQLEPVKRHCLSVSHQKLFKNPPGLTLWTRCVHLCVRPIVIGCSLT